MTTNAAAPDDALKHKRDRSEPHDAVATRAMTIGVPRDELYRFWRDFPRLGGVLENVIRIDDLGDDRTRWTAKGPAGHEISWTARVTEDVAGERIAWESEEGSEVSNRGVVEFRDAPGDRGSEIHAKIIYDAPGGALGKLVSELFMKEPGMQAKRDLRRVKMFLETGEISTSDYPDAAPRYKKADASDEAKAAETR